MVATLKVNRIETVNDTGTITIPAGVKLVGEDAGSVYSPGSVVNMHRFRLNSGFSSTSTSYVNTSIAFTVPNVNAGNHLYIQIGIQDLIEAGNYVYFQLVRTGTSTVVDNEWIARQTNVNGGWRGILAPAMILDTTPVAGNNNYTLQGKATSGTWYANYNGGMSFVTVWEIAQ